MPFTVIHVANYKGRIIAIKNAPCKKCEQCGEKFYTDDIDGHLEAMVNIAKKMMQEISVIDYAKVS